MGAGHTPLPHAPLPLPLLHQNLCSMHRCLTCPCLGTPRTCTGAAPMHCTRAGHRSVRRLCRCPHSPLPPPFHREVRVAPASVSAVTSARNCASLGCSPRSALIHSSTNTSRPAGHGQQGRVPREAL